MRYIITLLALTLQLSLFGEVVYKEVGSSSFVDTYTVENPYGTVDILVEMQGTSDIELVLRTENLSESVAHTENFDEFVYLQCGTILDGSLFFNIEGREYFTEDYKNDTLQLSFRFPSVGDTYHYAWMRVIINQDASLFKLLEYAYESEVDQSIVVCDKGTVAISETETIDVSIYPNPTSDFLNIDYGSTDMLDANIQLFDMKGRLIIDLTNQTRVDLSFLDPNIYVIVIKNGKSLLTKKIIKI